MSNLHQVENINFAKLRRDFPIFASKNRGKPIIYLDNAASAQKPKQVVDAISQFYLQDYANIHRGIYELSERSSECYEQARTQVKNFIHATHADEIIFVRGTTEGINLIAQSFGRSQFKRGDEVILSEVEHHSNIVPWYLLAKEIGIQLKIIPMKDDGSLDLDSYRTLFSTRTKLVTVSHASNVTGILNPIKEMTGIAHEHEVPILIDGAQAAPHLPIDVEDIDCDFYVFSGHKLYGPTGTGVVYGKKKILAEMPPYQGGGGMIESVSFSKINFADSPKKFEAGTPDIAGVIGFSAAIRYLEAVQMNEIYAHTQSLLACAEHELLNIPALKIIGEAKPKVGVISFIVDGIHPHDIGTVLDHEGIAVRASHHCAMPLMQRFQVPATVRISFGLYNNQADIFALIEALHLAKRLFA